MTPDHAVGGTGPSPEARAQAVKILCEIHDWTEGDFAYFGDAPKHVRQVDTIATALRADCRAEGGVGWDQECFVG